MLHFDGGFDLHVHFLSYPITSECQDLRYCYMLRQNWQVSLFPEKNRKKWDCRLYFMFFSNVITIFILKCMTL